MKETAKENGSGADPPGPEPTEEKKLEEMTPEELIRLIEGYHTQNTSLNNRLQSQGQRMATLRAELNMQQSVLTKLGKRKAKLVQEDGKIVQEEIIDITGVEIKAYGFDVTAAGNENINGLVDVATMLQKIGFFPDCDNIRQLKDKIRELNAEKEQEDQTDDPPKA